MFRTSLLTAAAALMVAGGAPALAQTGNDSMASDHMASGSMASGSHMRMSRADRRMMTRCNGMSHAMMMKNAGCKRMMRMHPDMMHGG